MRRSGTVACGSKTTSAADHSLPPLEKHKNLQQTSATAEVAVRESSLVYCSVHAL